MFITTPHHKITEDHEASCKTSPRDRTCLQLSQMENELIRKQGWSGGSAVFRAERSSDPAEITAGMEEGDSGGIERGAVSFTHFQPGLLRPSSSGRGLTDSTKTSRFLHKAK
ncbi:uncharacterized protein J5M81_008159 [Pluvialis apricaria]